MRFKVLKGTHSEGGKIYREGEIVDSRTDLNLLNSSGSKKFLAVDGIPSEPLQDEELQQEQDNSINRSDLEDLRVEELKDLAKSDGLDISGVTRKEDLIKLILGEE